MAHAPDATLVCCRQMAEGVKGLQALVVEKQESCPKCGAVSEVYSRVVGYLRPVNQWNEGKVEKFKQRWTFKIAQGA